MATAVGTAAIAKKLFQKAEQEKLKKKTPYNIKSTNGRLHEITMSFIGGPLPNLNSSSSGGMYGGAVPGVSTDSRSQRNQQGMPGLVKDYELQLIKIKQQRMKQIKKMMMRRKRVILVQGLK